MHYSHNRGKQKRILGKTRKLNENRGTFTNFAEIGGFINFVEIEGKSNHCLKGEWTPLVALIVVVSVQRTFL